MGAFVSDKTSPFLRRRKGRVGQDTIVEHTPAPALAGAAFRFAASNGVIIACGPNAATSIQVSKNSGASWSALALIAPNFIGNSSESGPCLIDKPNNIYVAQTPNNTALDGAGAHPGIGGAVTRIARDGNFSTEAYTVAGAPQESLAYTSDGTYFCSVGAKVAANAECAGGRVGVAVEFFDFPATTHMSSVIALQDPRIPFEASFIGAEGSAALDPFQAHKFWRVSAATWAHKGINVPAIVGVSSRAGLQRDALIIFTDTANARIVRSLDHGETWTLINMGGLNSPTRDMFRHGRFIHMILRDAARVRRSRNNGTTWEDSPVQLPSGTAVPDISCVHNGERYIFCHDGAANRIYKFKHANDI